MLFDQPASCCCYLWEVNFTTEPIPSGQDFVIFNYTDCLGIQQTITLTSSNGLHQYIPICTTDIFGIIRGISVGVLAVEGQTIISVASTGPSTYIKLQSCSNPLDYIYVIPQVLSLGGVIEFNEIPGCWTLDQTNAQCAPNTNSIIDFALTIKNGYGDCETCLNNNIYYLLTGCGPDLLTIVTQTDLSLYLDKVIKIDGDTNCYSVSLTEFSPNTVSVTVSDDYETCLDCLPPPPPPAYYLNSCTNDTTNNKIIVYNGPNPNALPNPSTLGSATLGVFTYDSGSSNTTLPGCFNIIPAPAGEYPTAILYTDVVSFTQFTSCPQCNAPTFKITACEEDSGLTPWITNTDLLVYDGTTQKIEITEPSEFWDEGVYCVTIERVVTVVGEPFTGTVLSNNYANCFECLRVCYLITPCTPSTLEPRIVYNDFSQYVGNIIKIEGCPDVCWEVSIADTCEFGVNVGEVTDDYETCEACAPVIPVPTFSLHPRRIKPGYFSKNSCLSTDYIERVNCTFAQEVYNKMIVDRYGITPCCGDELDTWDIKKQILDFELLTDPDLCKSTLPEPDPDC